MTWAEFKRAMEAAGVKDGDKLWYFDAAVSEDAEALTIFYDREPRLDRAAAARGEKVAIPGEFVDFGWVVYG